MSIDKTPLSIDANTLAAEVTDGDPNPQSPESPLNFDDTGEIDAWNLLSADDILTKVWPAPVWAIPEIMPVGLTILAGAPKVGKSWLALQLTQSVAAGGYALGESVSQGAALYLALEDPPRRLKERMQKQSWPAGLDAAIGRRSAGRRCKRLRPAC